MSLLKVTSSTLIKQIRSAFRLYGVYPTVVTPFTTGNGTEVNVDFGRFERMLIHLKRFHVAGFAVLGSSGEFAQIGFDRKIDIVARARKYLGENPVILAGAGLQSTADTIDLVNKMAEAGADACFVYNPSYFKDHYDNDAYLVHFRMIADHSPIPIILYNTPPQADKDIPVDVVVELAGHPNIIGLLDTTGDVSRIGTICKRTSPFVMNNKKKFFDVVAGSASYFLPALVAGCRGAICSLANILPFELNNLQQLFQEGKFEKAQKLQMRLMDPNEAVTTKYGVAGLKAILRQHFDIDTGSVRPPLRNLTEQETIHCLRMFQQNGFLVPKKTIQHQEDEN